MKKFWTWFFIGLVIIFAHKPIAFLLILLITLYQTISMAIVETILKISL